MYIVEPHDRGIHWASAWEDLLMFGNGVVASVILELIKWLRRVVLCWRL